MISIYAQPSQTEGLPRALIEAMSRVVLCRFKCRWDTGVTGYPVYLQWKCSELKHLASFDTEND